MASHLDTVLFNPQDGFTHLPAESRDVVIVSTKFVTGNRSGHPHAALCLSENSERLLAECGRLLKRDGLLWVYGAPRDLAVWGEQLTQLRGEGWRMIFKYWFALDIDDAPRGETLKASHIGLLLFIKATVTRRRVVAKLELDTDAARTPHLNCAACGNTLKDWGGKKHLMNPRGAAPSDVWRDLPRRKIADNVIPEDVLARVAAMSLVGGRSGLHMIQTGAPSTRSASPLLPQLRAAPVLGAPTRIEPDAVHHGDCVSFLHRSAELHPEGLFDLAFADPPYNLAKNYGDYDDERADRHYLEWCNEWLAGMARALKPGGSLFVLNLPKWAMHHAAFLNGLLEFRHWIAWDALSDPRGKIMPAHYALLWFTKPGGKVVCNYVGLRKRATSETSDPAKMVLPPDAPKYCLRASCIRERKARGEHDKVELTDVWFDVHRIKHKRDRDAHPCQLPDKLMERIIKLTTHRGGWVFDPFGGAGTTAIAAAKLGRRFVITEMDEKYVAIARAKLAAMKQHADLFGELVVPRTASVKPRKNASKREVELYVQGLAKRLGRVPDENDVAADNAMMLAKMDAIYPYRAAALKRAKVALADRI